MVVLWRGGGVEERIDALQQRPGLSEQVRRLGPEKSLQIRDQQRGGDAFARDIGQQNAEAFAVDFEKVVGVAADFVSWFKLGAQAQVAKLALSHRKQLFAGRCGRSPFPIVRRATIRGNGQWWLAAGCCPSVW